MTLPTDDPTSAQASEQPTNRSFVIPPIEIVAVDAGLNLLGRRTDPPTFDVTPESIRRNLRGPWVIDDDPFQINQFLHPYQGATYHAIARSSGLNYWQSAAFTFAGSVLWEIAGETTPPSKNDQIASGIAGTFLGEPLFRMADRLLHGPSQTPGFWRGLAATIVSPPTAFNHAVFGDRFHAGAQAMNPPTDVRVEFGIRTNVRDPDALVSQPLSSGLAGFSVEYGHPGKPGYVYTRPFDYFDFDVLIDARAVERLTTIGLIAGKSYQLSAANRGVWGLYGMYDFLRPDVFRLSTTALGLGTTTETWLSDSLALETTGLAGLGYAAAQTVQSTDSRDYHYGVAPEAVIDIKLIAGRRAALDGSVRGYFVSNLGSSAPGSSDRIARADAGLTMRIYKYHAVALRYELSRRDVTLADVPQVRQSRSTVGVFYTYLARRGFGTSR